MGVKEKSNFCYPAAIKQGEISWRDFFLSLFPNFTVAGKACEPVLIVFLFYYFFNFLFFLQNYAVQVRNI